VSLAAAVPVAAGQNAPPSTPEDKPPQQGEARPTGLPSPVRWPFNFDAGWGTFGFATLAVHQSKESAIPVARELSVGFEYASERNGLALDSNAWTLQSSYEFSSVSWKPRLTYRYAFFQGDNPATIPSEAFDPLFPASTTGAPGGRERWRASTSSPTPT
jgi:hypothetical protein